MYGKNVRIFIWVLSKQAQDKWFYANDFDLPPEGEFFFSYLAATIRFYDMDVLTYKCLQSVSLCRRVRCWLAEKFAGAVCFLVLPIKPEIFFQQKKSQSLFSKRSELSAQLRTDNLTRSLIQSASHFLYWKVSQLLLLLFSPIDTVK